VRVKKGETWGTKDLECLSLEGTFVFSLVLGERSISFAFHWFCVFNRSHHQYCETRFHYIEDLVEDVQYKMGQRIKSVHAYHIRSLLSIWWIHRGRSMVFVYCCIRMLGCVSLCCCVCCLYLVVIFLLLYCWSNQLCWWFLLVEFSLIMFNLGWILFQMLVTLIYMYCDSDKWNEMGLCVCVPIQI